jgi:DNA-binding PadR family transcriptional regulator
MLQYALLGLLRDHSDYGYNLKRRFDERMGTVWNLNIGQVYQTLHALEDEGLVEHLGTAADPDQYPVRRLFALTPKGERVLERWLERAPSRPRPVRDETLVRLLVLGTEKPERGTARLVEQEQLYRKHVTRLLAQMSRVPQDGAGPSLIRRFGLEAELLHAEAHLKWLEGCRQQLAEHTGPAPARQSVG